MLNDLYFAIQTTFPIFCIIALGILFKRIDWISDEFVRLGSRLVFNVSLPCLLFVKITQTDFRHGIPLDLVLYAVLATVVVFVLLDYIIAPLLPHIKDRGAFVQGTFRSNMGIIGLAYCFSAFGETVIGKASIYLAVMTFLFNVLSVITLSRHQKSGGQSGLSGVFLNILKNPLIVTICVSILISISQIPVPEILMQTGGYFARMALPLALLCAGASIRLQDFQASKALYWSVSGKLVVVPLLITLGGIVMGLRGDSLGVLFLMSSAPTAAAAYPMARTMGANYHLTAAIIAATSLGSLFSTALGIFVLRIGGMI